MSWRTIKEKMRKWIITLLIKLIQRTSKDSILIISRKGDTVSIKECGKWPDNWDDNIKEVSGVLEEISIAVKGEVEKIIQKDTDDLTESLNKRNKRGKESVIILAGKEYKCKG